MDATESERTLADVAEAATYLRRLLEVIDRLWAQHAVAGEELFTSRSPAAREAALTGYRQPVRDTLGYVDLLVAAALDHGDALCTWGAEAAEGEPTPVWAPWSVARSLVEVCAVSAWLTEANIPPRTRLSRMLTLHRSEALSRERLDEESRAEEIVAIEADVARFHIPTVRDRRGRWLGYEAAMPSRSELVRVVLHVGEEPTFNRLYSMLSAASHGETWAIFNLGYTAGERDAATGIVMTAKRPSAFWLWAALGLAALALQHSPRSAAVYRGWV